MPSTWERWGVDADGDGIANPWSPDDAMPRRPATWPLPAAPATSRARSSRTTTPQWYVDEVLQLAQSFGTGGLDATFNADPLQASFAQNTQAVADAKEQLVHAERTLRALSRRGNALTRRAASASLLSDRLALDQRAVRFGVRVQAARARVTAAAGRADQCPAAARVRPRPGPRGLVLTVERRLDGRAFLQRPVRLPGRRRPLDRLGLAPPPRLPGRRHRRAGRHARLRPRRCDRRRLLVDPKRALRDRDDDRHRGRPGMDVLPHVVPRAGRHPRRAARCRAPRSASSG